MSGPKDYTVVFTAGRLAEAALRQAARRQLKLEQMEARARANRQKLAEAARSAAAIRETQIATMLKQRRKSASIAKTSSASIKTKSSTADLDHDAQTSDAALSAAREALRAATITLGDADSRVLALSESLDSLHTKTLDGQSSNKAEALRVQVEETTTAAKELAVKGQETFESVSHWISELESDDQVKSLCKAQADECIGEMKTLLAEHSSGVALGDFVERGSNLSNRAKVVHATAEELYSKFATRNELLQDIIESLKEVGFVVSDPFFERPNDPCSPVVLKGVRGAEEMNAAIDLDQFVRSTWDNTTEKHCKDSFFAYMDQMTARGLSVTPQRDDLKQRPILRQRGEMELPRSASDTARRGQ